MMWHLLEMTCCMGVEPKSLEVACYLKIAFHQSVYFGLFRTCRGSTAFTFIREALYRLEGGLTELAEHQQPATATDSLWTTSPYACRIITRYRSVSMLHPSLSNKPFQIISTSRHNHRVRQAPREQSIPLPCLTQFRPKKARTQLQHCVRNF